MICLLEKHITDTVISLTDVRVSRKARTIVLVCHLLAAGYVWIKCDYCDRDHWAIRNKFLDCFRVRVERLYIPLWDNSFEHSVEAFHRTALIRVLWRCIGCSLKENRALNRMPVAGELISFIERTVDCAGLKMNSLTVNAPWLLSILLLIAVLLSLTSPPHNCNCSSMSVSHSS